MTKFILYTDGASSSNPGPSGIGFVVYKNDKKIFEGSKYIGISTNNQAEYTALVEGLRFLISKNIKEVNVFLDSQLVVKQLNGAYKVRNTYIKKLFYRVVSLMKEFKGISTKYIPREKNKEADKLAKSAIRF